MGVEVIIGALIAWAVAKSRRIGREADEIVNDVIDAGTDKVRSVVMAKLGGDPALAKLELEAGETGEVMARTRQRAELAIADAIDDDPEFADELRAAVSRLAAASAPQTAIGHSVSGTVHGPNVMIGGNVGGSVRVTGKGR